MENLKSFAPHFENSGLIGLVELLGLPESSLGSHITGMDIIRETECSRYKVVHDTFHHHLGPVLRRDPISVRRRTGTVDQSQRRISVQLRSYKNLSPSGRIR